MNKFILALLSFVFIFATSFAADIEKVDVAGLQQLIKSHNGMTMVVFWAPWCPHCMREMRMLRDNPDFIKKHNLQVIGLTKENDTSFAASTIKNEKFPFTFRLGTKELYKSLMKIDAVPYTQVYLQNGKINDEEYGAQRLEDLELMLD